MFSNKDSQGRHARWAKWTPEQHIDEAQRLAESNPALASVHATLAVQRTLGRQHGVVSTLK